MNKKNLIVVMMIIFVSGTAFAKPPKLTGNFEQGKRYAMPYDEIGFPSPWIEVTEELPVEAWAYNFHKGRLRLAQRVNKNFRYAVKYNYIWKDFYAAVVNNRNIINNYRIYSWLKLSESFNLRVGYHIRQQEYKIRPWDNMTHTPHILLNWTISEQRKADFSLRTTFQRYSDPKEIRKDKNQIRSAIGYEEEISDKLSLKAKYRYTFRRYTDNPAETSAVKESFSVGFDYQF